MRRSIRVVIADDHPIFRQGLVTTIEADRHIDVVSEADNGQRALELIEEEQPDVVILDVDMPVLDGIEVAKMLRERSSRTIPVFLTMHKDKSILKSLKSLGVRGYVLKDSAIREIVSCIKTVMAKKTYLSPALNDLIVDNFADSADSEIPLMVGSLTTTEKSVLCLITASKTNKEIAEELYVSVRTVESHRYNICQKLDLKGSHALLLFAAENKKKILASISK